MPDLIVPYCDHPDHGDKPEPGEKWYITQRAAGTVEVNLCKKHQKTLSDVQGWGRSSAPPKRTTRRLVGEDLWRSIIKDEPASR